MPYSNYVCTTPQKSPLAHKQQVQNNAGGYVFAVDKWARLERFLILGSDANTYYQSAPALTRENAACVIECFEEDARRASQLITMITREGRAPRRNPALFALALASVHTSDEIRRSAFSAVVPCCQTASSLFLWMRYRKELGGGSGPAFKRTLACWYESRDNAALAFQMIKYREREGFTHKRAIELCGKGWGSSIERGSLYRWARGKDFNAAWSPMQLQAFIKVQDPTAKNVPEIVERFRLPWEALPTELLRDPKVWHALIPHMGLTGLILSLGRMTNIEAITRKDYQRVIERIVNEDNIRAAKVHPLTLLLTQKLYADGHGLKGNLTWNPIGAVVDALDTAFYLSFRATEPTSKRYLLALDVSGSMTARLPNSSLTCREASAAMALVTMANEPLCDVVGFTAGGGYWGGRTELKALDISPKDRLDQAVKKISRLSFGRTDCALPMTWARKEDRSYDAIVVYTDNETHSGSIHPCTALRTYRKEMKLDTKLAVVGMTSTSFSIADPSDFGMRDFVGFDSAAPAVMADFFRN